MAIMPKSVPLTTGLNVHVKPIIEDIRTIWMISNSMLTWVATKRGFLR